MAVEVLDAEQLRIVVATNQRKYLAERPKRAHAVRLGVALQQARLGQAERAPHRLRMARLVYLVDGELRHRRQVLVVAADTNTLVTTAPNNALARAPT